VQRLRRVRPTDLREAALDTYTATRLEWALRSKGLPRALELAGCPLASSERDATARAELPGWAWRRARVAIAVQKRLPFDDSCLRRALLIAARLRPLRPELVIGIRDGADVALDAHAWVRVNGHDLDPIASEYLEFWAT
jgi:hypothetical protein